MDPKDARWIIECLPSGRTVYPYFKDRYAHEILAWQAGAGTAISTLKQGSYAGLLNKPSIKPIIASCGSGRVSSTDLTNHWPEEPLFFRLSLGLWASGMARGQRNDYAQTTRGGCSLVLHLDFSHQHDHVFQELFKTQQTGVFNWWDHPGNTKANTLAWARIDVDLDQRQALIEEIQCDWLRRIERYGRYAQRQKPEAFIEPLQRKGIHIKARNLTHYHGQVMDPYRKVWSEAMLFATLWFLREELGIHTCYLHTHNWGSKLKSIGWSHPPRTLYEDLPKRFGFQRQKGWPAFMPEAGRMRKKLRGYEPEFWVMS